MVVATAEVANMRHGGLWNALGNRQLRTYPKTIPRLGYLGIVTLTTIMLYYLYYEEGALTPLMLPYYHMSFQYFLYLLVASKAIGAFSALIGGLSDRLGRANMTSYGTLVVALVQLLIIGIHSKFGFALAYCVIGFVEGVILVSTPALMRDFSPQMGRGAAMGFWALGPTMGSLAASLVATHTLTHLHPWQDQFMISGMVCIGVVVISFFFLRELSPQLRDQLMVSEADRALIEAKARGISHDELITATTHPYRSMLRLDLISSSLAGSLLFYFASVSILTLFWVVVFGRSTTDANGSNVWYAAVLSGTLVLFGVLSDLLRVRKPFMLVGAVACIVMTAFLILQTDHPDTGYYSNVLVIVLLAVAIACAYSPWMAAYTEQVEWHNPALTASGLAIWGWVLRIVVALSFLVLPWVITTSTTLVDNQGAAATLQDIQAAVPYAPSTTACSAKAAPADVIAKLMATDEPGPQTLAKVIVSCDQSHNLTMAVGSVGGLGNPQVVGLLAYNPLAIAIEKGQPVSDSEIAAKVSTHSKDLGNLLLAEKKLVPTQKASPNEWKRWWWICLGGQAVFGLLVFTMRGPWSPRTAKRDFEDHERIMKEELEKLERENASSEPREPTLSG